MKTCRGAVGMLGLFLAGWGLAGTVSAQDARLASQSLDCAIWMEVLGAAWSDDAVQAQHLQQATRVFQAVHAQTGAGRVEAERVDALKQALQEKWRQPDARPSAVLREEAVVCGAWAEGFLAQGETYRYVPVYPKVVAPSVRSRYGVLLERVLPAAVAP